nr:transposase [uncultured Blautia sp.]
MSYEEKSDTYTCHARKLLKPIFTKNQKSKSGYKSEVTVYECEDCSGCSQKENYTKAKGNKRLYISKNFITRRLESYENILSETGIKYRINRSIQVEGAFGVLKGDYKFQRFLLRGKIKVKLEFLLLCLGYNINKLHAKIQNERTGSHLFQVRSA